VETLSPEWHESRDIALEIELAWSEIDRDLLERKYFRMMRKMPGFKDESRNPLFFFTGSGGSSSGEPPTLSS
jgi:hypothetical protein